MILNDLLERLQELKLQGYGESVVCVDHTEGAGLPNEVSHDEIEIESGSYWMSCYGPKKHGTIIKIK